MQRVLGIVSLRIWPKNRYWTNPFVSVLYNSAVYTSVASNNFVITFVTNSHFESGSYWNATEVFPEYGWRSDNSTTGKKYGDIGHQTDSDYIQLFNSMLEGYNASTPSYQDLTPSQCTKLYKDLAPNYGNLFLITNYTSNARHNNTILTMGSPTDQRVALSHEWMCSYPQPPHADVTMMG